MLLNYQNGFSAILAVTCAVRNSAVSITITDGVGSLTVEIIDPAAAITTKRSLIIQYPAVFDALVPGDYSFKVTDANGCVYQDSYTVVDVTEIDIAGAIQNEIL
jgi:hypothetical protein